MMRKYNWIFLLIYSFFSCSEPVEKGVGYGYLLLNGMDFCCDGEIIPLTRAVDAGLQVQILQNGVLLEGQDYAPGADISKRIVLPVGENYTVKAFTPDQEEAVTEEAGHPVYSVESSPFAVEGGDVTTISLTAPQINVGVGISCEDSFLADFTDISVTIVSESGRSVTISGADDSGYRYFQLPASGKLSYTVQATNKDREAMQKVFDLSVIPKNYRINLAIQ